MSQKAIRRILAYILSATLTVAPFAPSVQAASSGISASFLKSEHAEDYFVMVSKQMEMLDEFERGKTMYDLAEYSVDAKLQVSNTTLVLTSSKTNEYMIFGASDYFLEALYKSGGRALRYNSADISVEFPLTSSTTETNYTRMMVATVRPKGTLGEAWHISSFSGDSGETFTVRIKLPKLYLKENIKLMTYDSSGRVVEAKSSDLIVVKSGNNYYAKASGLVSGTYSIVKA